MARNTLPAVNLVRAGQWTLDEMEKWLIAVIENDKKYIETASGQLATKIVEANQRTTPTPTEITDGEKVMEQRLRFAIERPNTFKKICSQECGGTEQEEFERTCLAIDTAIKAEKGQA